MLAQILHALDQGIELRVIKTAPPLWAEGQGADLCLLQMKLLQMKLRGPGSPAA